MKPRLVPYIVAPQLMQQFIDFSAMIEKAGLEPSLAELVKIRASQINNCGYCLHMHSRDALAEGETELRITMLSAWRESPLYTDRERAALAWTETLTRLPEKGAPDDVYAEVVAQFSKEEQVQLTMLIGVINAWNRFGVGFHSVHPMAAPKAAAA